MPSIFNPPVPNGDTPIAYKLTPLQAIILRALAAVRGPLTRDAICETFPKGTKYREWMWRAIGQVKGNRAKSGRQHKGLKRPAPTLIYLGYVKVVAVEV